MPSGHPGTSYSLQDLGIPAIQPVPYGFRLGPWSRSDASEKHLEIESVNLQQHLFDLVLDDLRRLGIPLTPDCPKDCRSHSSINRVQSRFTLAGNRRPSPSGEMHRLLTGRMLQTGSPILPNRPAKQPLSQGLVIRLLGPVEDHLSSLGSSKIGASFLGEQPSSTASEAVIGVLVLKINQN
jgi:hypothetical protein